MKYLHFATSSMVLLYNLTSLFNRHIYQEKNKKIPLKFKKLVEGRRSSFFLILWLSIFFNYLLFLHFLFLDRSLRLSNVLIFQ